MLFSIIIPVYNCSKYIKRCVKSITSQGFNDYEIILVNDGSTDDSLAICKSLSLKDKRIQVLSQHNQGASTARNKGIDKAVGDYIWFVDADDVVLPVLNDLAEKIKGSCLPLYCFNYQIKKTDGTIQNVSLFKENRIISCSEYLKSSKSMYLWNKIFCRKSISSLRLLDGTKNTEDMLFCCQFLIRIERLEVCDLQIYQYTADNPNSTLRQQTNRNKVKKSLDSMLVFKTLNDSIKELQSSSLKTELTNLMYYSIASHLNALLMCHNFNRTKKAMEFYRKNGLFPLKYSNVKKANIFTFCINNRVLRYMLAGIYYLKYSRSSISSK